MTTSPAVVARMARALREFGYDDVTDADTQAEVTALEAGVAPTNVIGMFVQNWMREAGLLS